ncbi:MAG TPA: hypothetical protein DCE41_04630 [Cytophagales bacterium]|nr:hypothetical protein [Cytophagales bacterium]HAA23088.1 hypothetical protein [Cytophagales bacterium]HAP64285.1 hypothetical protein [Cytophagales bacterium]
MLPWLKMQEKMGRNSQKTSPYSTVVFASLNALTTQKRLGLQSHKQILTNWRKKPHLKRCGKPNPPSGPEMEVFSHETLQIVRLFQALFQALNPKGTKWRKMPLKRALREPKPPSGFNMGAWLSETRQTVSFASASLRGCKSKRIQY